MLIQQITVDAKFTNNFSSECPILSFTVEQPDGKPHGRTAMLIRKILSSYELNKYHHDYLQNTSITTYYRRYNGKIINLRNLALPNIITKCIIMNIFSMHLIMGDCNPNHLQWSSRLTNIKSIALIKAIENNEISYWWTGTTDRNKNQTC